jgi:integrase
MGIIESKDANGKKRFAVRKRWPDGSEIYRYVANRTIGKALLSRIEESITMGTWRDLREELRRGIEKDVTVKQFWERFRDEYCKPRMSSWERYARSFKTINEKIGDVPLREFSRKHLHGDIQSRKGKVSDSTINHDIAAIKKMFSYAFEVEAVEMNPLIRFKTLPVQETALRVITKDEFERLINFMSTPEMAAFVAITGETGMRKMEALNLRWSDVDFPREHHT